MYFSDEKDQFERDFRNPERKRNEECVGRKWRCL